MPNGSMTKFIKIISSIAGSIISFSIIAIFLWTTFACEKVNLQIKSVWKETLRPDAAKIADSIAQSYTNSLYERTARLWFGQQAMMTEKQKTKAANDYNDFITNLKTENRNKEVCK